MYFDANRLPENFNMNEQNAKTLEGFRAKILKNNLRKSEIHKQF